MISYYIQNRKGEVIDFEGLDSKREPLEFKPNKQSYAKQNQFGVITRGSFKQAEKKLSLKFNIIAESPDQYYYKLNSIAAFLYNQYNAPFYIYSVERRVRAKISITSLKENFLEGHEARLGLDCFLELQMEDALWESVSALPVIKELANGESIEINIGADTVESAPIFEIKNLDALVNPEFALSVVNDDFSANIIVANTGFSTDKIFKIDCADGKIFLDSIASSPSIIAGNYFPLLPGKNIITYECKTNQSIQMNASYRYRRLF